MSIVVKHEVLSFPLITIFLVQEFFVPVDSCQIAGDTIAGVLEPVV